MPIDDLERLKNEYNRRAKENNDAYTKSNPVHTFIIQQRSKAIKKLLEEHGCRDLGEFRILEVGCGSGGVMQEFLGLGAEPANLFGIDLLPDRLWSAHRHLLLDNLVCANGEYLPFPPGSFDLVLQFTAFSSILDPQIKHNLADDMSRVLKPSGAVIWYDFWWNPTNPQTHGIRPQEIRSLFPHFCTNFYRITLAPPIARRLLPHLQTTARFLESLLVFNSHYLAWLRKY